MRFLKTLLLLVLGLASPLAAQETHKITQADTLMAAQRDVQAVDTALTRYCKTKNPASYMKVVCPLPDRLQLRIHHALEEENRWVFTPDTIIKIVQDTVFKRDTVVLTNTVHDTVTKTRVDTVIVTKVVHDTVVVSQTPPPPPPVVDSVPPPPPVVTPPPNSGGFAPHPYSPQPNNAAYAEMPRDTVPVAVPQVLRRIIAPNLQAAYDTAKTGDLLVIPANTTVTSPTFRSTARTGWVTIQGTDSTSVIRTTVGGSTSAINIASQAHHIYFLGPLTVTTTTSAANALVRSYNAERDPALSPHHIVLNGVTITADTFEVRRCAWPDGAYMAIINSRLLGCASRSGDAQAILIANGPGPYRFENNYLEGGHQCFMSGGLDPSIPNGVPADVVFRWNTCFKPLYWRYVLVNGAKTYPGRSRQVKTIIETKNIRRALIERNLLINVWADAQAGFCFLFKSTNQDGTDPSAQTLDVTARYNRCRNMANGANFAAHPQGGIAMTRVSFYGNQFDSLSTTGGEGIPLQILDDVVDLTILNNSFTNATNQAISFDGVPGVRTVISRNVIPNGAYGVKGNSTASGNPSLIKWLPNGLFMNNLIIGADCSTYSAYPTTTCKLPVPVSVGADLSLVP